MKKFITLIAVLIRAISLTAQVGNELYRPTYHYTPRQNWMNDPNGLVFYNGKYHLFYQHNPSGIVPGAPSWGHAVSTDLVNWEEKPIAIPTQNGVSPFSGSVVVDWNNTSGFGINGQPPLVAIYTGKTNVEDQRIAYSNDEGLSWTNYRQNPVLERNNNEFRDPKVIWHKETQKWIMVVSLGNHQGILFYSSPNLKDWTLINWFSSAVGNVTGAWECPDFFRLPVDNDSNKMKWVLVHSVSPTVQYFIGDFDGQHFSWQNTAPSGILIDDFESINYVNWATTGISFGVGPVSGNGNYSGFLGNKLIVSGNESQGKLVSRDFTIQKNYISFLIGGGYNPGKAYIKLVVNDQTVRTSTGMYEDILKWRNWEVSDLVGKAAHIEIVDSISSVSWGWGHINVDHIIQSDTINDNINYGQIDYGKDFFAVQSFSDIPEQDGRKIWLAWLGSWAYAQQTPTTPWRGMQTIPRELKLKTINGQIKLVQKPVEELNILHKDTISYKNTNLSVINSAIKISVYKQFELKAKIAISNKKGFSLKFKKNGLQYSQFVFDFVNKEIVFSRANSGALTNDDYFARLQVAPLIVENGYFDLQLFVDNSSAELFTAGGQIVMSNQIFPDSTSNQIELTALEQDMLFEEFDIWNFEKTRPIPPDLPPPPPPPSSASSSQNTFYFRAYPNPLLGDNDLTIKINNGDVGKVKIKIFNASGMLIHEFRPASTSVNIPLSKLTKGSGMFYLRGLRGQATYTERIIVLYK